MRARVRLERDRLEGRDLLRSIDRYAGACAGIGTSCTFMPSATDV